jgi:hypothetical protein
VPSSSLKGKESAETSVILPATDAVSPAQMPGRREKRDGKGTDKQDDKFKTVKGKEEASKPKAVGRSPRR